ncbi:NUDIX domain-containing protein [Candidatus Gracilibacteria bacterium]|nr:NUDIX domain-containing protein [Candidatus Gracilibacteria bacterium]
MSKIIIVVDKNDNILGYKSPKEMQASDIYRVSASLIKNSKGEFLLAQRVFTKKHNPGEWSFSVAGTIEKGEDYEGNIIKETQEEIGIENIEYTKLHKKNITGEYNFFCQFYTTILDLDIEEFTIQEEEVEALRWFSREEILIGEYEGNPISKTLLSEINKFQ